MARITKAKQKILGINAPSDQIAAFGSCKTGAPVYTTDMSVLQTDAYEQGWQEATDDDYAPYREEMNGVQYGLSRQIAYLQQEGLSEWIDTVTYYKGSVVKVITGDSQVWYQSLADDNTGNNPTVEDSVYWKELKFASVNLDNLSSVGQAILDKKASVNLDNLSSVGQAILDKKVEVEALLAQNGYAKFTWNDGNKISRLLIQWTQTAVTTVAANTSADVYPTLPTTFSTNAQYRVVACFTTGSDDNWARTGVRATHYNTSKAFVTFFCHDHASVACATLIAVGT